MAILTYAITRTLGRIRSGSCIQYGTIKDNIVILCDICDEVPGIMSRVVFNVGRKEAQTSIETTETDMSCMNVANCMASVFYIFDQKCFLVQKSQGEDKLGSKTC